MRCVAGEVFDVAVDIRKSSPTFGQWVGVHLSGENKRQLWIPEGFTYGFVTLQTAEFCIKTTDCYAPQVKGCLAWNDSEVNIAWPINDVLLSGKISKACRYLIISIQVLHKIG